MVAEATIDAADENTVFIVPLGATEQHGKHLPFETDSLIAQGICAKLIEVISDEVDVRILPVEYIGYSPEHMDHAGSKTLTFDEAINRWIEIGKACATAGGRRIIFMNAHGGNSPLVSIVTQELRVRHSILAVATKWDRFIKGTGIVSSSEERFGVHGGDVETSVMLALHPDMVSMNEARDFPNLQEMLSLENKHLRAYGSHAFGWKAADLNSLGVTGNAGLATVEKGMALLKVAVEGLHELVIETRGFDLTLLKDV